MSPQDNTNNRLSVKMTVLANKLSRNKLLGNDHHHLDTSRATTRNNDHDHDHDDDDDDSVGAPFVDDNGNIHDTDDNNTASGESSTGANGKDDSTNPSQRQQLGSKETSRVNRAKFVAYFVLLITATTVALIVHMYMTNVERELFENQYTNDSRKIVNSIGRGVVNSLAVLDNFGFVAVSLAKFFRQDKGIPAWPFVSIPDFGLRAAKDRASCSGITFSFQPILRGINERLAWETFTSNTTNQYWVNQSKIIQETDNNFFGTSTYNTSERIQLWNEHGTIPYDTEQQLFMPQWQNYPANSPSFNRDWLSLKTSAASMTVINSHRAVASAAYMLPDPNNPQEMEETQFFVDIFSELLKPGQNATEPVSDIIYPIIEAFDGVRTPDDPEHNRIVATVITSVYWREYISRVLPESSVGIVVVIENPCNPSFTYQVNGPDVDYLGRGDFHDPEYEYMKVSRLLTDLQVSETSESRYSGVPLNEEHCPFTINVYPSDVMKKSMKTNRPVVFTICVLAIFVFGAIVFYAYDASVERRQALVLAAAEKTNCIVSSLFPATIRDQIMNAEMDRVHHGAMIPGSTKAIADLFPDTTIFFADLAGFHEWSKSRCPRDVFELLETLYSAMDQVAKKRKVFKVETIGDCYVAVAGLPDPVPNHAVIIARFAIECVELAKLMTTQLVTTLGPDTNELCLRVGLNSGPTTAGVLRGEKARFQLFGDTVNTAARMETSGKPGRIHCSQKTADLLIKAGKEKWVTKREDIISVKGKGKMVTYWIQSRRSASSMNASDDSGPQEIKPSKSMTSSLIDWNVELFTQILKRIIVLRVSLKKKANKDVSIDDAADGQLSSFISFDFDAVTRADISSVNLPSPITAQLLDFITLVATHHCANQFHNFEHTCLSLMSIQKMFERMEENVLNTRTAPDTVSPLCLVDPISRLAILFVVLVRHTDHPGFSEISVFSGDADTSMGARTKNHNVNEEVCSMLMQPKFEDLRNAMFATEMESILFKQIVNKAIAVPDIFDIYARPTQIITVRDQQLNAPSIVEYIMKVSTLCHTMQPWSTCAKWGGLLCQEMISAYEAGLLASNPTVDWDVKECEVFDHVVIPLVQDSCVEPTCVDRIENVEANKLKWLHEGKVTVQGFEECYQSAATTNTDSNV